MKKNILSINVKFDTNTEKLNFTINYLSSVIINEHQLHQILVDTSEHLQKYIQKMEGGESND